MMNRIIELLSFGVLVCFSAEIKASEPVFEVKDVAAAHSSNHSRAIVVLPDAYEALETLANGAQDSSEVAQSRSVGFDHWFSISYLATALNVARAQVYGGGSRLLFNLWSDDQSQAIQMAPGVDIFVIQSGADNDFFLPGPYEDVWVLGTDVDVSYYKKKENHFGLEIGMKFGVGLGLKGQTASYKDAKGVLHYNLGLFLGVRI